MIRRIICFVFAMVMVLPLFGCAADKKQYGEYCFNYPLASVETPSDTTITFNKDDANILCYIDIFYYRDDYFDCDNDKDFIAELIIYRTDFKFDSSFELDVIDNEAVKYDNTNKYFLFYDSDTLLAKYYMHYQLPEFTIRKT